MSDSDSDENGQKWYLIETDKDYCIVEENSIVFDETLNVGDKVKFFYSKNLELKGTIRFISGNQSKCAAEAKRLRLVAKTAANSSFHEDRPRKAAVKFNETLKRKGEGPSNGNGASKATKKKKKSKEDEIIKEKMVKATCAGLLRKESELKQKKNRQEPIYSDSEQEENGDTSEGPSISESISSATFKDSDAEDDLEAAKVASQLASKYDVKTLKMLLSSSSTSGSRMGKPDEGPSSSRVLSDITLPSTSKSSPFISFKLSDERSPSGDLWKRGSAGKGPSPCVSPSSAVNQTTERPQGTSKKSSQDTTEKQEPLKQSKAHASNTTKDSSAKHRLLVVPTHQVHGVNNTFKGTMFVVTDTDSATEVHSDTGVFCLDDHYNRADVASSATMVARRLLEGVFTKDALLSCSVSGLPPRGKGKESYRNSAVAIKPFLCPKAINAIVCLALKWQKSKHFLKKKDDAQIRQAIAVRLNELQTQAKKSSDLNEADNADGQHDNMDNMEL